MVVQHLKQIGKVKKLDKCVPHALIPNEKKKNHHFKVLSSLFMCNDNKPLRGSIPRQIDKKSRVPKEEIGVWNSQKGGKDKLFCLYSFSSFQSLSRV